MEAVDTSDSVVGHWWSHMSGLSSTPEDSRLSLNSCRRTMSSKGMSWLFMICGQYWLTLLSEVQTNCIAEHSPVLSGGQASSQSLVAKRPLGCLRQPNRLDLQSWSLADNFQVYSWQVKINDYPETKLFYCLFTKICAVQNIWRFFRPGPYLMCQIVRCQSKC